MAEDPLLQAPQHFKPLNHIIQVQGEKAGQLLHGQFTNSLKDLPVGRGNYNLLLSLKGKVLADLYVFRSDSAFFLIVPAEFVQIVSEHVQKIAPLSRCTVTDLSQNLTVHHVLGALPQNFPRAELYAAASGVPLLPSAVVFRSDRLGVEGYDVLIAPHDSGWISALGFQELSPAQTDLLRIKAGRARVGVDATEKNLPQEARLDLALHFNKGCYLGQEIIARLHFKGHVNKILARLESPAPGFIVGHEIKEDGKAVGEVTSVGYDATERKSYLLGYVPVALHQSGKVLTVDEQPVTVVA